MYSDLFQAILLSSAGLTSLAQFYLSTRSNSRAKDQPNSVSNSKQSRYEFILFYESAPKGYDYSPDLRLIEQLEQIKNVATHNSSVTIVRRKTTPQPKINLQNYRVKGKLTLKHRLISSHNSIHKNPHTHTNTKVIIVAPWATTRLDSLQLYQDERIGNAKIKDNKNLGKSKTVASSLDDIIEVFKSMDRTYHQQLLALFNCRPKTENIEALIRYNFTKIDHKLSSYSYLLSNSRSTLKSSVFARQYFAHFLDPESYNKQSFGSKARQLSIRAVTNLLYRSSTIVIILGLLFTVFGPNSNIFTYLWLWYCFFYGMLISMNKRYSLRSKFQLIIYAPIAYVLKLLPAR